MKNKKPLYLVLFLIAFQIIFDFVWENKILSQIIRYLIFSLNAFYFTTFRIKKDYILFIIGIFCYLVAILTRISTNSSFLFLSIFSSIMGMGIHFWLYYMNKED